MEDRRATMREQERQYYDALRADYINLHLRDNIRNIRISEDMQTIKVKYDILGGRPIQLDIPRGTMLGNIKSIFLPDEILNDFKFVTLRRVEILDTTTVESVGREVIYLEEKTDSEKKKYVERMGFKKRKIDVIDLTGDDEMDGINRLIQTLLVNKRSVRRKKKKDGSDRDSIEVVGLGRLGRLNREQQNVFRSLYSNETRQKFKELEYHWLGNTASHDPYDKMKVTNVYLNYDNRKDIYEYYGFKFKPRHITRYVIEL